MGCKPTPPAACNTTRDYAQWMKRLREPERSIKSEPAAHFHSPPTVLWPVVCTHIRSGSDDSIVEVCTVRDATTHSGFSFASRTQSRANARQRPRYPSLLKARLISPPTIPCPGHAAAQRNILRPATAGLCRPQRRRLPVANADRPPRIQPT